MKPEIVCQKSPVTACEQWASITRWKLQGRASCDTSHTSFSSSWPDYRRRSGYFHVEQIVLSILQNVATCRLIGRVLCFYISVPHWAYCCNVILGQQTKRVFAHSEPWWKNNMIYTRVMSAIVMDHDRNASVRRITFSQTNFQHSNASSASAPVDSLRTGRDVTISHRHHCIDVGRYLVKFYNSYVEWLLSDIDRHYDVVITHFH